MLTHITHRLSKRPAIQLNLSSPANNDTIKYTIKTIAIIAKMVLNVVNAILKFIPPVIFILTVTIFLLKHYNIIYYFLFPLFSRFLKLLFNVN